MNHGNVPVTLRRVECGVITEHRRHRRRDVHRDVLAVDGYCVIGGHPVVGAVGGDAADLGIDLIEQWGHLRWISDIVFCEGRGHDPPDERVHRQMQLAPGAPRPCSVLFLQPFARALDLQSGAVDQQMDGSTGQATAF